MALISKENLGNLITGIRDEMANQVRFRTWDTTVRRLKPSLIECICLVSLYNIDGFDNKDMLTKKDLSSIFFQFNRRPIPYRTLGLVIRRNSYAIAPLRDESSSIVIRSKYNTFPVEGPFFELFEVENREGRSFLPSMKTKNGNEVLDDWFFVSTMKFIWIEHGAPWLSELEWIDFSTKYSSFLTERMRAFYVRLQEENSNIVTERAIERIEPSLVKFTNETYFNTVEKEPLIYEGIWRFSVPLVNLEDYNL